MDPTKNILVTFEGVHAIVTTYLVSNPKTKPSEPTKINATFELGICSFIFIEQSQLSSYDYGHMYHVEGSGSELAFPGTRVTLDMNSFMQRRFSGISRGKVHPTTRAVKTVVRCNKGLQYPVYISALLVSPPITNVNISFDQNIREANVDDLAAFRNAKRNQQRKKKNPNQPEKEKTPGVAPEKPNPTTPMAAAANFQPRVVPPHSATPDPRDTFRGSNVAPQPQAPAPFHNDATAAQAPPLHPIDASTSTPFVTPSTVSTGAIPKLQPTPRSLIDTLTSFGDLTLTPESVEEVSLPQATHYTVPGSKYTLLTTRPFFPFVSDNSLMYPAFYVNAKALSPPINGHDFKQDVYAQRDVIDCPSETVLFVDSDLQTVYTVEGYLLTGTIWRRESDGQMYTLLG